ncbi:thiamine-phosphate kinase [Thalassoporum mexicanum PCC 7367]|uniref:thiamine-phosphate kinase n=1 Tax=Thalassoporum mexicanum TaxID=3457544 RepID=UPI00029FD99A|nr:thiamine-phosphate kinase [Pseudanabaena sp. PCC 7367]AFY68619.1 thiamine-phosphate kinase [Pseudanabaena sp. PCC 7367]
MQTVKDVGERGLIKLLRRYCSDRVGDDAALMGAMPPGYELVVTTDVLVNGIHFSETTTSAEDVGWRAAAVNLSDLAAMGATPWGVTIALGLTAATSIDWVERVYGGFTDCLQKYQTELVGGDTVRSPVITLSVTAFGQVQSNRAILRSNAQVGDAILITGAHGLSRAGLEILLHPEKANSLSAEQIAKLHRAHQRPQPRLDVPELIWQHSDRAAGMDSSDGLADAIVQICEASGVSARLDWQAIPIPTEIELVAGSKAKAIDWLLYGGEDFELVLCMPRSAAIALTQKLEEAAIIGEIVAGDINQDLDLSQSFQHF